MQKQLTYPVQLTPAEEGGFTVLFPGLPIVTEGDTEKEALHNAKEALLCHFEGLVKEQKEDPNVRVTMLCIPVPDRMAA